MSTFWEIERHFTKTLYVWSKNEEKKLMGVQMRWGRAWETFFTISEPFWLIKSLKYNQLVIQVENKSYGKVSQTLKKLAVKLHE